MQPLVNIRLQPGKADGRFRVLLTQDRPYAAEHWTSQLPRLLEPQGVVAYVARSGREAIDLAEKWELHAAVIDLGTPFQSDTPANPPTATVSELWLTDLFRRLPNRPPVVLVHGADYSHRKLDRVMHQALRLEVFSVLAKPVELETMLTVFQRLLHRVYDNKWPES